MDTRTANLSGKKYLIFNNVLINIVLFRYLKGELNNSPITFDDTFRSYNDASVDGTTFPGKPGKIDYVMVDKGAMVKNAWIDRNWADQGKASDHWPVAAVVDLLQ